MAPNDPFLPPPQVVRALQEADHVLMVCHVEPDPDALGSLLALRRLLVDAGKRVQAVSPDPVPRAFHFLPDIKHVLLPTQVEPGWQIAVVLDCEAGRTGALAEQLADATVVNIDHHATNAGTGPLYWIEPGAAAVGELIWVLSRALGATIDPVTADFLYLAIMGDTGSFRYSNTSAHVLQIAADLVQKGANPAKLASNLFDRRSEGYLRLLAKVLDSLERGFGGRVAWVSLTREMVQSSGVGPDEAEGFVQYPRMIEGVEVALLFRESDQGTRVSFRSHEVVDVSVIARSLGGGGHARAAGCMVPLPLAEAKVKVLDAVSALFSGA